MRLFDSVVCYLPIERSSHDIVDMLLNFIGNAAKMTKSGHVAVKASVHTSGESGPGEHTPSSCAIVRAEHELLFVVEDTGPGVPPDAAEILFKPFLTA